MINIILRAVEFIFAKSVNVPSLDSTIIFLVQREPKRTFESREESLWLKLYTSMVRPHLDNPVQVWNPSKKMDLNSVERVQERATKIPWSFKEMSYEKRLERLGITKLTERRIRGDLIEA